MTEKLLVLEKIRHGEITQITNIDLSNCKLTEFPLEVSMS
jgi:hypothetical protein